MGSSDTSSGDAVSTASLRLPWTRPLGRPPGPYALDQLGGDLLGLFDELEIKCAAICGLSLGGMVSLWMAANHPERLTRLVLANTGARIGTEATWKERIRRSSRAAWRRYRAPWWVVFSPPPTGSGIRR